MKHVDPKGLSPSAAAGANWRPWCFTAEEDAAIRAAVGRETAVQVAARIGRPVTGVRRRAKDLGCPFPRVSGRQLVVRVLPASARREQVLDAGDAGGGVAFLKVRQSQCRWPLWRDGERVEEWRYCGAKRLKKRGCAYCEAHAGRAFRAEAA